MNPAALSEAVAPPRPRKGTPEWLEINAAAMRERLAKRQAALDRRLEQQVAEANYKENHNSAPGYEGGRGIYDAERLVPFREARERKIAAADARNSQAIVIEMPKPEMPEVIDPNNLPARKKLGRPTGLKKATKDSMPLCPRCDSSDYVCRAGKDHGGRQRYRCKSLKCGNKTFGGPGQIILKTPQRESPKVLMCYRCGETNVRSIGYAEVTGWTAHCPHCKKNFIQGGRRDLEKYHLLLAQRIGELVKESDLLVTTLQMAYQAVIEGYGYCWTLDLQPIIKAAKKEVYATWGSGSDHPTYRLHNGQKMLED